MSGRWDDGQVWAAAAAPADVLPLAEGLELRRWRLAEPDLDELTASVLASQEHLVPWMPWAVGFTRGSAASYLERCEEGWSDRTDFQYGIREGATVLGSCGLHSRIGPGRLEIGYWVHVDRIGEGIARRTAAALTEAAFGLSDVVAVEIRHDPDNVRSGRVPEVLGYRALGVLAIGSTDETIDRDHSTVWELTREDYADGAGRLPG